MVGLKAGRGQVRSPGRVDERGKWSKMTKLNFLGGRKPAGSSSLLCTVGNVAVGEYCQ